MNEYLNDVMDYTREIPEDDRIDLIQYYEEYFLDSGKTVEDIYEEYGTPKQFALMLKINYFSEEDDSPEAERRPKKSSPKRQMRLIWLIILGLFASPILLPLALAFVLVIGGLLFALMALIFSIYVFFISILGAGLFLVISGVGVFTQSILSGLFFIGLGMLATGVGLFFVPLLLKGTKALFQLVINFAKWVGRRFVTKRRIYPTL
ncbi:MULTISPECIES: DUF1700 domain-containing protein [unclassified Enterococcus]|jgi:uncharacterized membrane protein|uniref:DUF1700 domain-containing protein n=1 Tax=unclassified Enterococcus TaxID=2608891 RepID=UPI000353B1A5|nr:hypothetical protein D920_01774 [Enterococcus faecalis 13-SD-W-01]